MKKHFVITFGVLVSSLFFHSFVSAQEFHWGGRGYDTGNRNIGQLSRFRFLLPSADSEMIEFYVDTAQTAYDLVSVTIIAADGFEVISSRCGKMMRHQDAPWICGFPLNLLKGLEGRGRVEFRNRAGEVVLVEPLDLMALGRFLEELTVTDKVP